MAFSQLPEIASNLTQESLDEQPESSVPSAGSDFDPWGLSAHFSSASIFPPWEKTEGLLRYWMLLWQDQWERQLRLFGVLR